MENRSVPLLLIALPVFFLFLGANAIWDANEAFYVETPRQMVLTGDYINPSFNGLPRFNKPVLSYWIVAGLYKMLGTSVAVERVGIACGALLIILAACLLGRALRSPRTGALAGLMVATAPRVVMHSRRIFIDVWLTAFMALTLACFVEALRRPEQRRRWLLLMYVAIGLGVLTKGPIALAMPSLACVIWLAAERRLPDVRHLMLLPGAAIVVAIVAPWYAAVYAQHGWTYIAQFIFGENIERFSTAMTPAGRDTWFYLPVLLTDLFPWAPLVLIPLATAWRGPGPGESATHAAIRRLLWVWIVTIVGFFSLSHTKEDLYIFPVAPAVAALVADLLASDATAPRRATGAIVLVISIACVLLGVAAAGLFRSGPYHLHDALAASVVLGLTGIATLVLWTIGRRPAAVGALALGFIAFNYLFVSQVLPDAERFKPVPPLAKTLTARAAPGARVASLNMSLPSLSYYLNRPVPELSSAEDAIALLGAPGESWLITNDEIWNELRGRSAAGCVVDRLPLFAFDSAKVTDLARGTPPPDVLLVTNKCGVR
ncbi:MAG: ArnT family glycosyltransferase [Vicinamibacterales bacterium]